MKKFFSFFGIIIFLLNCTSAPDVLGPQTEQQKRALKLSQEADRQHKLRLLKNRNKQGIKFKAVVKVEGTLLGDPTTYTTYYCWAYAYREKKLSLYDQRGNLFLERVLSNNDEIIIERVLKPEEETLFY